MPRADPTPPYSVKLLFVKGNGLSDIRTIRKAGPDQVRDPSSVMKTLFECLRKKSHGSLRPANVAPTGCE